MSSEITIDTTVPISPPRKPSAFRDPIYAVCLGIVLPLLCLLFDPIVFSSTFNQPLAGSYSIVCYWYIGLSMLSMAAWLITKRCPSVFTGLLFGGWAFALLLGLAMLPISVVGLVVFIGVFGFSPFLTAATFWYCAKHAREVAGVRFNRVVAISAFVLYFTVPPVVEAGFTHVTTSWVKEIATGSDQSAARAMVRLKWLGPAFNTDLLVREYNLMRSAPARERLAKAHLEFTGQPVDVRLYEIRRTLTD